MKNLIHEQASSLNESSEYLDSTLSCLPGIAFRCQNNRDWTMEYLSDGMETLTGYRPDELIDGNVVIFASLIVKQDRDRVWQKVQAAIKESQPYEITYRIKTKQDDLKWIWERGCAQYSETGHAGTLQGIIIDITSQKQTEMALRESKQRFQNIVNGSIEAILIHRNWKALFTNKSMANMLGYNSVDDILALNSIMSFIAPQEQDRIMGYASARIKGEFAPNLYEFEAICQDGTSRILEIKSTIMEWDEQPAILSTLIDITERRSALREVEQQRQQLAHMDRLSTLGEMAVAIAHEINQPLTAIANRSAAARRRVDNGIPDPEKLRDSLEAIEQQAQRAGEIMQHILRLAKKGDSRREIIDISSLLKQCLKFAELDGRILDRNITTDLKINLSPVFVVPIQIHQVILNLIRNAVDSMTSLPIDDRQLTIGVKQHDSCLAHVYIKDCGSGIEKETEKKLFQSFFTTKETGLGMGLSICHTIVADHNGRLWFTRNDKGGTTFRFTLPLALEEGENHAC